MIAGLCVMQHNVAIYHRMDRVGQPEEKMSRLWKSLPNAVFDTYEKFSLFNFKLQWNCK